MFSELLNLERFQTAEVTFSVTQGHSMAIYFPISFLSNYIVSRLK